MTHHQFTTRSVYINQEFKSQDGVRQLIAQMVGRLQYLDNVHREMDKNNGADIIANTWRKELTPGSPSSKTSVRTSNAKIEEQAKKIKSLAWINNTPCVSGIATGVET